jgi:hypothetical protein
MQIYQYLKVYHFYDIQLKYPTQFAYLILIIIVLKIIAVVLIDF